MNSLKQHSNESNVAKEVSEEAPRRRRKKSTRSPLQNMEKDWLHAIAELEQLKRSSERELRTVAEGYSKQHKKIRHAQHHITLRNQRIHELEFQVNKYTTKIHVLRSQIKSLAQLVAIPIAGTALGVDEKGSFSDATDTEDVKEAEEGEGGDEKRDSFRNSTTTTTTASTTNAAKTRMEQMTAIRKAVGTLTQRLGEEEDSNNGNSPFLSEAPVFDFNEPTDDKDAITIAPVKQITAEENRKLRALFDQVDKDHNGSINVREMLIALRKIPELGQILNLPQHIRQENGSRDAFEHVFQEMDSDGDANRSITYPEFQQYITKKCENINENMNENESKSKNKSSNVAMVPPKEAPPPTGVAAIIGVRQSSSSSTNSSKSSSLSQSQSLSPPPPPPPSLTSRPATQREAHVAAAAAAAAVAYERTVAQKKQEQITARIRRQSTMETAAAVANQKKRDHDQVEKIKEKMRHGNIRVVAAAVANQKRIDHKKAQKTLEEELVKSKRTSAIMSAAQLATVMAKHKADGETIEANVAAEIAEEVDVITQTLELKMMMENGVKLEKEQKLQEKVDALHQKIQKEQNAKMNAERELEKQVDALNKKIQEEQNAKIKAQNELNSRITTLQSDLNIAENANESHGKNMKEWKEDLKTHMDKANDLEAKLIIAQKEKTKLEKSSVEKKELQDKVNLLNQKIEEEQEAKVNAENELQALQGDLKIAQNIHQERGKEVEESKENIQLHMQKAKDLAKKLKKTQAAKLKMEKKSAESLKAMKAQLLNSEEQLAYSTTTAKKMIMRGMKSTLLKWLQKHQYRAFTTWRSNTAARKQIEVDLLHQELQKAGAEKQEMNHVMRVTLERAHERIEELNEELQRVTGKHSTPPSPLSSSESPSSDLPTSDSDLSASLELAQQTIELLNLELKEIKIEADKSKKNEFDEKERQHSIATANIQGKLNLMTKTLQTSKNVTKRQKDLYKKESKELQEKIQKLKNTLQVTKSEKEKQTKMQQLTRSLLAKEELGAIFNSVMDDVRVLLECDRATLFLADLTKNELYSQVAHGTTDEIRIPMNRGLVGEAATSKSTCNISDAYEDARFNKSVDVRTGYRTQSVLCIPVLAMDGSLVGVIEAINKTSKEDREKVCAFVPNDENIMQSFAEQISVAVHNCRVKTQLEESQQKVNKQREQNEIETKELQELLADQTQTQADIINKLNVEKAIKQKELTEEMEKSFTLQKQITKDAEKVNAMEKILNNNNITLKKQLEEAKRKILTLNEQVKESSASSTTAAQETELLQTRVSTLERNNRKSNMRIGALDKQLKVFREQAQILQAKSKIERDKKKKAARAAAKKRKADKAAKAAAQ